MSYEVILPKPVQKQLDKLSPKVKHQIIQKLLALAEEPRPLGVKKLKGLDSEYRIRIGDYRVRYEINDDASRVLILHCKHRRDIYRK